MFKKFLAIPAFVRVVFLAVVVFCMTTVEALAIESEGAKKVKEVTTSVSGEGVEIIIAVLGGLVALIALSIILPKAIGFIRRFI